MKKLLLIMPSVLILHFLFCCFLSLRVRNPMSIEKLGIYYLLTFPLLLLCACILYLIVNLLQRPRRVCVFMIIAVLSDLLLIFTYIESFTYKETAFMDFITDILGGYGNLIVLLITILFISVYLEVVTTFIKNRKGEVGDFETDGMKVSTLIISSVLLLYYIVTLIIAICVNDSLSWLYPTFVYAAYFPVLLSVIVIAKAVIKLVCKPHRCNIFALLATVCSVVLLIFHILQPEFTVQGYHLNGAQIIGLTFAPICILMYLDFLYGFEKS